MRSVRSWLAALLRRAPGTTVPDQHTHPPQPRSPGLDALAATAYGARISRRI